MIGLAHVSLWPVATNQEDEAIPRRLAVWLERWLVFVEVATSIAVVVVCIHAGYHSYAKRTDWQLWEILHGLNENWKGALLVGALLFHRTLHRVLAGSAQLWNLFRRTEATPSGSSETLRLPPSPPPPPRKGGAQ